MGAESAYLLGRRVRPWTPARLGSKVVGWWGGRSGDFTLDGSGNVSSWASRLAGGVALVQSTQANRPAPESGVWGRPTVYCNGSSSIYTASNLSLHGNFAICAVLSTNGMLWEQGNSAFSTGAGVWALPGNGNVSLYLTRATAGGGQSGYGGTLAMPNYGQAILVTQWCDGTHAGHKLRINGADWALSAFGAPYNTDPGANKVASNPLYFGVRGGGGSSGSLERMGEAVVLDQAVLADVLATEAYLARSWSMGRAGQVCWIGDSTSAAYVGQHSMGYFLRGPSVDPSVAQVVMLANPGDTIAAQKSKWDSYSPRGATGLKVVVIMVGINDLIALGHSANTIVTDLIAFIADIKAANPGVKVLLLTPLPAYQRMIDLPAAGGASACLTEWTSLYTQIKAGAVTGADAVEYRHTDDANDGTGRLKSIYEVVGTNDHIHENDLLRSITVNYVAPQVAAWGVA